MNEIQSIAHHLLGAASPPVIVATLVEVSGSSYRRAGARAIFGPGGRIAGSISGGCLEEDLAARAYALLTRHDSRSGNGELAVYDTTSENDLIWGVGLGCHGVVKVWLERHDSPPTWAETVAAATQTRQPCDVVTRWRPTDPSLPMQTFKQAVPPPRALWICGAGDDARPLARLAAELGWTVTVTDPRPAHATADRFPPTCRVFSAEPAQFADQLTADAHTAAVIMSHHYRFDLPYLNELLNLPLGYVGLLGPRVRAHQLLRELGREAPAHLHAPVGLDLGGDGAEAVALAILAEIQAWFEGRPATALRERTAPIHERGQ